MEKSATARTSGTPFHMIFSDLDGTLLDTHTYGWEEALPALNLCARRGVPVILVSSKTRAEMDQLRRRMSIFAPFISENGGGIFFPRESVKTPPSGASMDQGLWKWSLGLSYSLLIKGLQEIREDLGWNLRGFSNMSIEEISRLTGLDRDTSRLAAMREYDEPFIVLGKQVFDENALFEAAAKRGLLITAGGRFYHLQGKNDKGQAMEKVTAWYRQDHGQVLTIALGDSPNDFPMLERADLPFLIRSQNEFPELKDRIPRLMVSSEMGPKGWNSVVLDVLGEEEEDSNV